jgi:hypothetical protein
LHEAEELNLGNADNQEYCDRFYDMDFKENRSISK